MTRPSTTARDHARERGQVIVIFAGGIVLFMLLLAIVVDVSWYWANTLRVQRAADAAALAGVVWLPDCPDSSVVGCASHNARDTAIAEATKNRYVNNTNATVTTAVDPKNTRRLIVTVSANVGTYFMKVIGINSIAASRNAKAEFILPVPMGSPQNYFGVGQFLGTTKTTQGGETVPHPADTGWDHSAAAVSGGTWSNPTRADGSHDGSYATSGTTANNAQQWNTFGLLSGAGAIPNDPTVVIDGLEVSLWDQLQGSGTSTSCQLRLELSWDGGGHWTTAQTTPNLSTTARQDSFGANNSMAAWVGRPLPWVRDDFTDTHFRAKLTFLKPTCGGSRSAGVDTLQVRVSYHTTTTNPITYTYDENAAPTAINDPVSGSALAPQNFWGAIFTKGGVRQNGDYFAPATIGGSASGLLGSTTGPNPTYDASGYDYTIDLTNSSGGQVRLFDPIFCATGPNTTSGWYGAGDHWTTQGSSGGTAVKPVAVTYTLWNMGGNPYSTSDDTLVATLAYDPAGKTLGDFGGSVGDPATVQNNGNADKLDCSANAAHNQWVTLASGLSGGMYRVNVETSSQAPNATVGAENLFAIWVKGTGGKARVYGGGRMAGYTQVGAAPQSFFLAQIKADAAGKILEIKLFDPGDVAGDAKLYIKSPDGNAYNNATFSYQADAGCKAGTSDSCSGTGRQYIQTAVGGHSSFDNSLITISIPLSDNYGSGGLTPSDPGNPNGEAGWWKIYYDVTNANDTTTWQVDIRGNPVHLVVP